MMRDAAAGAFGAVVFYDLDRFGRNAQRSMEALHTLADLDVSVWDYSTGQPVDLDSFEGETITFLKARFAQQYREQIRKHTRDAMRRKVEAGHVVGAKVYGYDNVRREDRNVARRINEEEANTIRMIYARFAAGENPRAITKALNAAGVPPPRTRRDSTAWAVGTVRAMLKRKLYRGIYEWGKKQNAYGRELGKKSARERGVIRQPPESRIIHAKPELRIVDEESIARVDARLKTKREKWDASIALGHRRPERAHGKYLLSGGMLRCPLCKGHFEVRKRFGGQKVYACATRRHNPGMCGNRLALPLEETDEAIRAIIEESFLGSRITDDLLTLLENVPADETTQLREERDRLRGQITNLVQSVAKGMPAETIAPTVREYEAEIARIEVRLSQPRPVLPDVAKVREQLLARQALWSEELRSDTRLARVIVRRLVGPITTHVEPAPDFIQERRDAGTLQGLENLDAFRELPAPDAKIGRPKEVAWEAEAKPEALLDPASQALLGKTPT